MSTIQKTGRGPDLAKVAQNLESAGRAIINPGTLGKEAMGAFVALKGLGELSKLLPPGAQKFVAPFLALGMQNLMKGADPAAREAVRGYSSSLAVARGLVPDGLLEKAVGKQQKQELYKAARNGDTATVKSILRHNKKTAAPPVAPRPTTDQVAKLEERAARLDDPGFASPQLRAAREGKLTPEMADAFQRDQKMKELGVLTNNLGPATTKQELDRMSELVEELRQKGPTGAEERAALARVEDLLRTVKSRMDNMQSTTIRNIR